MRVRVERPCFLGGTRHTAGAVVTVDGRRPLADWMTPLRDRARRPEPVETKRAEAETKDQTTSP